MDLNAKLEDEILFSSDETKCIARLNKLKGLGILTIGDFINADIDNLIKTKEIAKQHKAFQKMLRYKYLGDVLTQDVLLDKKYNHDVNIEMERLYNDMYSLGFYNPYYFQIIIRSLIERNKDKDLKMIDYLREISIKTESSQGKLISQFYVDYYDNVLNKQLENPVDSSTIEELKNQIISLLSQRNALDLKIAQLTEQVNMLEGGNITNGRK